MNYQIIIGLEIHLQLNTQSKMFCSCNNNSEDVEPNTNICPICLGHPGVLPLPNEEALKKTIKIAQALQATILKITKFDRKNYFYPDLPKAYQISQYDQPLAKNGSLEITLSDKTKKKIRLRRIHLEEDAAKLLHSPATRESYIDFNRAGTPLVEIVTEPDLSSPQEAGNFLRELRLIARYLKVSSADMEKGHLRCDANINIKVEKKLSPIVEIKNLNSFKAVEESLRYEAARLYREREEWLKKKRGKMTYGWDAVKRKTYPLRIKEEAEDYRYFPEPDIFQINTPQILSTKEIKEELPHFRRQRFKKEYKIKEEDIEILVQDKALGDYYEQVVSELRAKNKDKEKRITLNKLATNWILSELQKLLKAKGITITECKISAENFAELIKIIHRQQINSSAAQIVLKEMFEKGSDPSQVIQEKNLEQIQDLKSLQPLIEEVIHKNQEAVESFKKGKTNALQFLVGQVMRLTQGKAHPKMVQKLLYQKLSTE